MPNFPRPAVERRFWRSLQAGRHLLVPGPRRIGKTTLLKEALRRPQEGFHPVYVFVESVDSTDSTPR
jgi:predicted AAA+ superfamily ATPase